MQHIQSLQNKNFKIWQDCLESKGVQTHHLAILAGKKVINDTLKHYPQVAKAVLVPEHLSKASIPLSADVEQYILDEKLFNKLDIFGTKQPLLVVQAPKIKSVNKLVEFNFSGAFLYLPFQDPKNIGAALRTAAAFGLNKILLSQTAAHPFHPESLRASSGGVFCHEFFKVRTDELNNFKQEQQINLIGLDMNGQNLKNYKFPKNFILIPGMEGPGLIKNVQYDARLTIPISAQVESLNATVATALVLYQWSIQNQ